MPRFPRRFRARAYYQVPGMKAGLSLSWSPTHINNATLASDQPLAIELSSGIESKLDRNLNNAVVQTVRGVLQPSITPTAANTRTRMAVSFGIAWLNTDYHTNGTSDAAQANPADDSHDWLWRYHLYLDYVSASTTKNDQAALLAPSHQLKVHVKSKRRQPSLKHRLFLMACFDNANMTKSNIGSADPSGS